MIVPIYPGTIATARVSQCNKAPPYPFLPSNKKAKKRHRPLGYPKYVPPPDNRQRRRWTERPPPKPRAQMANVQNFSVSPAEPEI